MAEATLSCNTKARYPLQVVLIAKPRYISVRFDLSPYGHVFGKSKTIADCDVPNSRLDDTKQNDDFDSLASSRLRQSCKNTSFTVFRRYTLFH